MKFNSISLLIILFVLPSLVLVQQIDNPEEKADALIDLTEADFDSNVISKPNQRWLVMFYAPWCPHCRNAMPAFNDLAKSLEGKVKVARVDCTTNPSFLSNYSIPGFPTFLYFYKGEIRQYEGERTVEAWTDFVNKDYKEVETTEPQEEKALEDESTPSNPEEQPKQNREQSSEEKADSLAELVDNDFDNKVLSNDNERWFAMFYVPWCPHCQQAMPTFDDLARSLQGQVNLGRVNCDTNAALRDKYSIQGYPTFLYFYKGEVRQYEGERTVEAWTDFVNKGYKKVETTEPEEEKVVEENSTPTNTEENGPQENMSPDGRQQPQPLQENVPLENRQSQDITQENPSPNNLPPQNVPQENRLPNNLPPQNVPQENRSPENGQQPYAQQENVPLENQPSQNVSQENPSPNNLPPQNVPQENQLPDNRQPQYSGQEDISPENRQPQNISQENPLPNNLPSENLPQENQLPENHQPQNPSQETPSLDNRQSQNVSQENRQPEIPGDNSLIELTVASFDKNVLSNNNEKWLVMFYSPECPHCNSAIPAFESLARVLEGKVKVGRINCDKNPALRDRYSVKAHPTFLYFYKGEVRQYEGDRTVEAWTDFINKNYKQAETTRPQDVKVIEQNTTPTQNEPSIGSGALIDLNQDNFNSEVLTRGERWMVMFYAPWCPHCKHAMPAFTQLAKALKGHANIGRVDCDANAELRTRFSIRGYPTFLYFSEGEVRQFEGPRTVEAWTEFVNQGYQKIEALEESVGGLERVEGDTLKHTNRLFGLAPEALIVGIFVICGTALFCYLAITHKKEDYSKVRHAQLDETTAVDEESGIDVE